MSEGIALSCIQTRTVVLGSILLLLFVVILCLTGYTRSYATGVAYMTDNEVHTVKMETNREPMTDNGYAMELLYNDIVKNYNITLKIAPYEILHDYPFWKIMQLPTDSIQYVPIFKNPCFFVRTTNESCKEFDPFCGQVRLRCLPYFFIAGVPKCGSTDLFMRLISHQQTRFSQKEICWWNGRGDFSAMDLDAVDLNEYTRKLHIRFQIPKNYSNNGNLRPIEMSANKYASSYITTDACPTYFKMEGRGMKQHLNRFKSRIGRGIKSSVFIPHKIHHLIPQAKIMFLLREPKAKIMSQYIMQSTNHHREISSSAFHKIVVEEITWFKTCKRLLSDEECLFRSRCTIHKNGLMRPSHCDTRVISALYSVYMKTWLKIFQRQNILFIKFENYMTNPLDYIGQHVLPFLDMEPYSDEALQRIYTQKKAFNKGHTKIDMWNETRHILDEFLAPYNKMLIDLLGEEFRW